MLTQHGKFKCHLPSTEINVILNFEQEKAAFLIATEYASPEVNWTFLTLDVAQSDLLKPSRLLAVWKNFQLSYAYLFNVQYILRINKRLKAYSFFLVAWRSEL